MRALIVLLAVAVLGGCASIVEEFSPAYRHEQQIELCDALGLVGKERAECVIELETAHLGRSRGASYVNQGPSQWQVQQQINTAITQDRTTRQILNHGAGGCTPNFATGGCL